MKIRIRFSNGRYEMHPSNTGTVEITLREWDEYRAFLKVEQIWHDRMRELDNAQFEIENLGRVIG